MITISKIYSNTNLFNEVKFNQTGINIILGRYSTERSREDINGIGKSSLIRLIDYCLISDNAEKLFTQAKYDFLRTEDHNVVLEIFLDNQVLQIMRYFSKPEEIKMRYANEDKFTTYTKDEIRIIFTNIFFPTVDKANIIEGNRFRSLMNFFIKDDVKRRERSNALNFIHASSSKGEIYSYNLFLLGIPNNPLQEYLNYTKKIEKLRDQRTTFENKILQNTGKTYQEYRTESLKIDQEIKRLEKALSEFEFMNEYKNLEGEILNLSNQIKENLSQHFQLSKKLSKIRESYEFDIEVDIENIRDTYSELKEDLGDFIKKQLDEVIAFRKTLADNRKKFLIRSEKVVEEEIESVEIKINNLEQKRKELYKLLDEKGALDSIKNTYKSLLGIKVDQQSNKKYLEELEDIGDKISYYDVEISKKVREINESLKENRDKLDRLRLLFKEIVKNILPSEKDSETAFFDIDSTLDKRSPLNLKISIPASDALGKMLLQLVVYDLMVMMNLAIEDRDIPRFLIHDGAFHGITRKSVHRTLKFLQSEINLGSKFQYIVTFNEDEIELESLYQELNTTEEQLIVVTYEDSEPKMIFRRDLDKKTSENIE